MNNKLKKISKIRWIRILSQAVFFVLLPGLYISAFSGIKQLYLSLYHWNFNWGTLLPQMVALLAVLPVTLLAGRFFCGWMCAFGSLGDLIYGLSTLVIKKRKPIPEEVDRILKFAKYVLLFLLVIVVWSIGLKTFQSANPWDAFGMLFTVGKAPDFSYVLGNLAPAFFLLVAILAGSFYIERFFCRYLCPLGAIFAIVSKLRITAIKKPSEKCGNCRVCTKNCPMGIPLYREEESKSGECINCLQCVSKCPRKNVRLTVVEQDAAPILAGALAVTVMTGVYYAGSFATNSFGATTNNTTVSASNAEKLYQDGTYQGSGIGFRNGTTTVSVTVENGLISDISTVSTQDDGQFYDRAFNSIVSEIIDSQDTNVDAVSGATYSSNGIMEAVASALQDAKLSSTSSSTSVTGTNSAATVTESPSQDVTSAVEDSESTSDSASNDTGYDDSSSSASNDTSSDSSSSSTDNSSKPAGKPFGKHAPGQSTASSSDSSSSSSDSTTSDSQASSSPTTSASDSGSSDTQTYQDGTYEGTGTGFRGGTTKVSVTIENGKITDVTAISNQDDGPFFNRAYSTIVGEVIDQQNSNVDAVSGATYSSNGIMEAVADALSQAQQ